MVRLKGGDPFVFGRGGEEAEALAEAGIPFEVVPGVTSAVAVPAYAGIPLTHRGVASSFAVVTGHGEAGAPPDADWARLATAVDTLVVLMGASALPRIVETLLGHGRPAATPVALIRWGTTDAQTTVVGTLADIVERATAHETRAARGRGDRRGRGAPRALEVVRVGRRHRRWSGARGRRRPRGRVRRRRRAATSSAPLIAPLRSASRLISPPSMCPNWAHERLQTTRGR